MIPTFSKSQEPPVVEPIAEPVVEPEPEQGVELPEDTAGVEGTANVGDAQKLPQGMSSVESSIHVFDNLRAAWESQSQEPDQWAKGVVDAFKELYDAAPSNEYRKILRLQLQSGLRGWVDER